MGPNEQNQHFAELRQKACLYTHVHAVVLQRGLQSLDSKLEHFDTKSGKSGVPKSSQINYGDHWPRISNKRLSIAVRSREQKTGPTLDNIYFLINSTLAACFGHAGSLKQDPLAQYFHRIFWLKVNNDIVFEANVLEY